MHSEPQPYVFRARALPQETHQRKVQIYFYLVASEAIASFADAFNVDIKNVCKGGYGSNGWATNEKTIYMKTMKHAIQLRCSL